MDITTLQNNLQRSFAEAMDTLAKFNKPQLHKPNHFNHFVNFAVKGLNLVGNVIKYGTIGTGVVVVTGAAVIGCVSVRRHLRKAEKGVVTKAVERLAEYVTSAAVYEPDVRDAAEGECHDFISYEVVEDLPDAGGDEDGGPPGLAMPAPGEAAGAGDAPAAGAGVAPAPEVGRRARGPAVRRVARRKVRVHATDAGTPVRSSYYGEIVAEARIQYHARGYDAYNAQLARSFMVRMMQKHGVRPTHIAAHIEDMVTAVFTKTPEDERALDEREQLVRAGLFHLPPSR
jgi:hypothetical protein